jgi:hypothetical protein
MRQRRRGTGQSASEARVHDFGVAQPLQQLGVEKGTATSLGAEAVAAVEEGEG